MVRRYVNVFFSLVFLAVLQGRKNGFRGVENVGGRRSSSQFATSFPGEPLKRVTLLLDFSCNLLLRGPDLIETGSKSKLYFQAKTKSVLKTWREFRKRPKFKKAWLKM